MATYLQGVTDYIPDYQPFQPNLNFYANLLQAKQTQYDTNYKAINNLYAQLYNADLTRTDNIEKKDNLLKQIDFNLKRVSGLDLSLQQNVDQATQVFRPFYEDKYLMKDMAWTKNFNNTYNSAIGLKNSSDEKQSKKYWDTGVKELQYRREEFKDAAADEALNMASPTYTPYDNALEKYLKVAKDLGISADITKPDSSGLYFVRQKNGNLIMPALQKLFISTYATDPNLQKIYQTQAYVDRKDYIYQNADQKFNGDKLAAEKEYLQEKYNWLSNYSAEQYKKNSEDTKATESKITAVQNAVTEGNVNFKQKSYFEMLDQAFKVNSVAEEESKKLNDKINGTSSSTVSTTNGLTPTLDLNNIELARLKVDAGVANFAAQQDVLAAADIYAYKDFVQDIKVNPVGLEGLQHSNAVARLNLTHSQKMQQIAYQGKLKEQADAKKALVESGQYYYDSYVDPATNEVVIGPLKLNEQWNVQNQTPGSSGQAGPEIKIDQNNREATRQAENKLTGNYIDDWFIKMANLVEQGGITEEEAWAIMNGGTKNGTRTLSGNQIVQRTPISKQTAEELQASKNYKGKVEKVGDKYFSVRVDEKSANSIEQFKKYYQTWLSDKDAGRKVIQAKLTGVMDGMDEWMKKNSGHPMAEGYYNQNYSSAKQWVGLCDSYEQVEIENKNKIKEALTKAAGGTKKAKEVADLYVRVLESIDYDPTGGNAKYLSNVEEFEELLKQNYTAKELFGDKDYGTEYLEKHATTTAKSRYQPKEKIKIYPRVPGSAAYTGLLESLNNSYMNVTTSLDPNIGLKSVVPVTASAGGKAALFADKSFYNVNPAIPASMGSKAFIGTYNDIMRINWNQDFSQYKVSDEGSTITARNLDSDFAKSLLSELYNGFKPGSKVAPFRVEQSQVAMENRKLGAMTIYPTMEFLKDKVKSVYDPETESYTSETDVVNKAIQKIYENGLTFTAPRTEWTNDLFLGNVPTPTEQIINAKGKIEYNDVNNSGGFVMEKVNLPNVDYRIAYKLRSLQSDGSVIDIPMDPQNLKRGNNVDQVYQLAFGAVENMYNANLEMYRSFHKSNNFEAMKKAEENLGFTPRQAGFNF